MKPLLFVATLYAIRTSTTAVHAAIADVLEGLGGAISSGELALREGPGKRSGISQALMSDGLVKNGNKHPSDL